MDPISERAAQILETSKHILMPLSELYHNLTAEGLMGWTSPEMFEYLLSEDNRFDIFEGLADAELMRLSGLSDISAYGLLAGPLVMLRRRGTSPEIVQQDLLNHLKEMNSALETAWYLRPTGDAEIESELLQLLMMGDMLERELKHTLQLDGLMHQNEDEEDVHPGDSQ
ncbi:MAG: hypothetical protein JXA21_13050 [Anaerolineae bacterium]|nr:hypothetical protein [Anaerolineae bacterium]